MKKILLVLIGAMFMFSCKKEINRELPSGTMPPNDVVLESKELNVARGKNPHGNPHDSPPPPPPTTSFKSGCFLLDFDGQSFTNSIWGVSSVSSSGLTPSQIASVLARVTQDYSFDDSITITTDENIFNSFPENKRMRIIATTDWQWYGQVGGVAYLNSFNWYGEKECFVFTPLLSYNEKYISDAMSHEGAHTTGARHHSYWIDCVFVSAYLVGDDLMGNSYNAPSPQFKDAVNDICCTCMENTKTVIRNSINQ